MCFWFPSSHDRVELPVFYTMKVSPAGDARKIMLKFRTTYEKSNPRGGMDGYRYTLGGRTYRDVESLQKEPMEELSERVQITTDIYGENVLKTHTPIPTFDSGDREWDSKEQEFLFFDGKNIHLVVLRGGYRIAKLTFYEQLLSADLCLKPLFEKLGWPAEGIRWT